MLNTILMVSTSFLFSLFLTPFLISLAKKKNIYDIPDSRKTHKEPTPLLGGLAVYISSMISIIIFAEASKMYAVPILVIGATGVTFMGLIDDIISLSAKRRMVILFCIALIVFFGCIRFYFAEFLMLDDTFIKILFFIYIIFWIVGITNAINFSDGLDGLASYLSLVSTIAFSIIFCLQGRNMFMLPITLALFGAIAGFIPYNRNPAMVFMGDAGSMFIGFMLSLLSITSISRETTLLSIIVPVYILFVPILDMCLSVLRRLVLKQPVMKPDNLHFHHKLNDRFKNHLIVVMMLSLTQILFAAMGIYIFVEKLYSVGWVALGSLIAFSALFTILSALKKRNKNNPDT
ncbi:MAG: glycosyltransferase family 4 protein [Christensenellales bacterium]|jgi:UDP-GlcNAc:undecaprenyl-phosphate GlcNAc-1-phosphate transferase